MRGGIIQKIDPEVEFPHACHVNGVGEINGGLGPSACVGVILAKQRIDPFVTRDIVEFRVVDQRIDNCPPGDGDVDIAFKIIDIDPSVFCGISRADSNQ